ncbi:aminoglycoside phospho transferase enzyme family protein [Mycolicibacter terrae]|nr:aminoglycoside phospho transferase enzyme family protein [Mycolicibacter terrae]
MVLAVSTVAIPPPLVDRHEMSAQWFTQVLRHCGVLTDGSVTAVAAAPIGTGQVADTLVFTLSYDRADAGGPASVVAKLPAEDPNSRQAAVMQRLYEREVRFYQYLGGRTAVTTPGYLFSDIETATGRFVLLLENMTPVAAVDQLRGFTVEHARAALAQAAALHAPFWEKTEFDDYDWLNHSRNTADVLAQIVPLLIEQFCERYAAELGSEIVALMRRLSVHAAEPDTRPRGPITVVHGDFRTDNMLFDAKGGDVPVAVVDWQTVDRGCGLLDVAFLLGTALDPELRRTHEQDLVRGYFDALTAAGVCDYDWEQCWADYRRQAAYAVFFLPPAAMLVERTDRGDEMFLTMIRRACAQISDLGTEALLDG